MVFLTPNGSYVGQQNMASESRRERTVSKTNIQTYTRMHMYVYLYFRNLIAKHMSNLICIILNLNQKDSASGQ